MIDTFRKLAALLSARDKRRAAAVFVLMLCMAVLDAAGVASVMPFVAVLTNPDVVSANTHLKAIYDWFGFTDRESFLSACALALLGVFVLGLMFKALTSYAILRFSTMRLHTLSCRLFASYLRQPYEFFLGRNTAALAKSILAEVGEVINGVLIPTMTFVAKTIVAVALIGVLIFVNPVLSLMVALGLGLAYGAVYVLTRRLMSRLGAGRLEANRRRFVLTNEVLGGVKELRLLGRENDYLGRFEKHSLRFSHYMAVNRVVKEFPRYAIEAIAFGGMLAALLYFVRGRSTLQDALPVIALYGFAVYRLLPTFQEIFATVSQIRFFRPAVDVLHNDLVQKERTEIPAANPSEQPLHLQRELRLVGVTYRYPDAGRASLKNIHLTIPARSVAAFVGGTGAGKTTLADTVLGLLSPTEGEVLLDGQPLTDANVRAWQRSIGYVPQSIFLADDTVSANIAFGLPTSHVDQAMVECAARIAQIHDFIVRELPQGYRTIVGERGVRLSGGQRQRLAIARALYRDPDVIVFDEATSALDNATEAAVMEAIQRLRGEKTIILIAHRLTTITGANYVFVLEKGRLVDQGDYGSLAAHSSEFRRLAAVK